VIEDGRIFGVELDAVDHLRREAVDEIHHALVFLFVVHADGAEIARKLVAQDALHQVQVAVDDRRSFDPVGAAAHLGPGAQQVVHIVAQVFGRAAVRRQCAR
jgi:hypothetical protein